MVDAAACSWRASAPHQPNCLQGFVRTTRKYWVRSQDVSRVKYTVLQNLPVFQFDASNFQGDAQLVNSVYLDNVHCELYHGRLDKRPDAIAVRLRWYGAGDPSIVFVERKTHREGWKGETSVKERFVLKERNVLPFLNGQYKWEQVRSQPDNPLRCLVIQEWPSGQWSCGASCVASCWFPVTGTNCIVAYSMQMEADLQGDGRSEEDIDRTRVLFQEVQQAVQSKLLRPMTRTQYQRVAFQIPFDATVRISLDTNLRMYRELREDTAARSTNVGDASSENSSEDPRLEEMELKAWYVAPSRACLMSMRSRAAGRSDLI